MVQVVFFTNVSDSFFVNWGEQRNKEEKMKKGNVVALLLGILSFCTIFIACKSAPEDLNAYYTADSQGAEITLWIPQPKISTYMEEWINQLVHNQITENFINFSPVTVVERDNNLALQEMMKNEDIGYEENAASSFGYMRTASHALSTEIVQLNENNYSVNMKLLHIETNSTKDTSHEIFSATTTNFQQKLLNTINEMCYKILSKGIGVKFTPVGKSLLNNKVDEETLESYESLAKAEHAQEKMNIKQQQAEQKLQEDQQKLQADQQKLQAEIQRAEAAKTRAALKAQERAEKKEERKRTQRKQQLNVAYTNAAKHHGAEIQLHFTGVNHLFFGLEAGALFNEELAALIENEKKKNTETGTSSQSNSDKEKEIEKMPLDFNVAGVVGVNFSLFNKKLAPYAKAGVGYLNDTRNKGLGFLAGGGVYSSFSNGLLIFFDYSINYLWEKYFFDKYTIGIGIDVSSL